MIDDPLINFRTLTWEQQQAFIAKAHAERSQAIAEGFRWLGARLMRLLKDRRVGSQKASASNAEPCCA